MLFKNLTAFSQQTILSNEDTLICFNLNQSKFLLTTYYQKQECDSILSITDLELINILQQNALLDSIIVYKSLELSKLESTYNDTKILYDDQIALQGDLINKQQRKIKLFGILSCILVGTTVVALIF